MKKYRRQFRIRVKPTAPKAELAAAVAEHFASIPIPIEEEAISGFLQAVQRNNRRAEEADDGNSTAAEDSSISNKKSTSSPMKVSKKKSLVSDRAPNTKSIKNTHQSNSVRKQRRGSESRTFLYMNVCLFTL